MADSKPCNAKSESKPKELAQQFKLLQMGLPQRNCRENEYVLDVELLYSEQVQAEMPRRRRRRLSQCP